MTNSGDNQQSRTVCDDIQSQLVGYALGEEQLDLSAQAHLRLCPACQATVRAYRGVVHILPFDTADAAPSPQLRSRLLAAVEAEMAPAAPALSVPQQVAQKRRAPRTLPRAWAMWAAVAAILIGLVGWNVALQQHVDQLSSQIAAGRTNWQTLVVLMNEPDLQVQTVSGPAAHGTLWKTPSGQVACIMAEDLPTLAEDQAFQVWLQTEAGWVNGGTFPSRNGRDWFIIRADHPISSYTAVRVTTEPSKGSTVPHGPALLEAAIARG